MEIFAFILVLISSGAALALEIDGWVKPCNHDDLLCLRDSLKQFLNITQYGNKELEVIPINPLTISNSQGPQSVTGPRYSFVNVSLTGLKDVFLSNYQMDMDAKTVEFTTTISANVTSGRGKVAYMDIDQTETSVLVAFNLSVTVTTKYNYTLVCSPSLSASHFVLGPDQHVCAVNNLTKLQVNEKILEHLSDEHYCALIIDAYKVEIQNFRKLATLLPAQSIIKDIII